MNRLLVFLVAFLLQAQTVAAQGDLYLYIWSEYIPDEVLEAFTEETGIKVHISTYDSNEAMYTKLKIVGQGYDLVVPSADYVGLMSAEGLLQTIDRSQLPNFANLSPAFVNQPFDPDNGYSIPYMWGSTAIAVNGARVDAASFTSLEDLWNPELDGLILLPNDPREVLGLGLLALGYSFNETDPGKLAQAAEHVKPLMERTRVFDSDSPKSALLAGEVAVAVLWNGEGYIANNENSDIAYIYPEEGFSLWVDSFCIPKNAVNVAEAHAFINYILRPEVSALISDEMGYSTPNAAALQLLPPELGGNPIVYPDEATLSRGQYLEDLGEAVQLYEDHWVRLKAGL